MIKTVSALLLGASLLAAAPASATEYLLYTVNGRGTVTDLRGFPTGESTSVSSTGDTVFQFLLPAPAAGALSASSGFYDRQTRQVNVTASPTALTFSSGGSSEEVAGRVNFSATVTICGDFSSGLPTQSFTADIGCSNANSSYDSGSAGLTFSEYYSGNVISVTVNQIVSQNLRVGLVAAPSIPEPATWAMMLVGFGMIAATARYRRRPTSLNYA